MHNTSALLRVIYRAVSPALRRRVLLLVMGMIVAGLMEMALAGAISLLGIALATPESLQNARWLEWLYAFAPDTGGGPPSALTTLILVLTLITLASAAKNLSAGILTYQQVKTAQSIAWDISMRVFKNYLAAPFIWHTQQNTSTLNTYIIWRTNIAIYCQCVMVIASQVAITILLMLGAVIIAPRVAPMFLGGAGTAALLIYLLTKRKAQQCGNTIRQINISANKLSLSALQGIREVQIYNQRKTFSKAFNSYAPEAVSTAVMQNIFIYLPSWILETTGVLILLLVVVVMAHNNTGIAEVSGVITLLAAVSWRILPAVNKVVGNIIQLKIYHAQVESVVGHAQLPATSHTERSHPFHDSLELRSLSFQYPNTEQAALKNISLTIRKGDMVGFIGTSGAGKSTLVGLLTGLLTPQSGEILLDGTAVASGPGYLRIGYVPQNPYIMDAGLAENLALSAYGEKPDLQRVMTCCKMAAMDFLDDLPDGVHTILGERGVRLSGGQLQRVAIARALYGNPDLLIFDEATSALDGAAEAAIQSTILDLSKEVTIVLIAHRLETVKSCNTLFWLKDGIVHQKGNTGEVLARYTEFLRSSQARNSRSCST